MLIVSLWLILISCTLISLSLYALYLLYSAQEALSILDRNIEQVSQVTRQLSLIDFNHACAVNQDKTRVFERFRLVRTTLIDSADDVYSHTKDHNTSTDSVTFNPTLNSTPITLEATGIELRPLN